MKSTLDIVTVLLLTIWSIAFFGYNAGMMIHLLLMLAAVTVIVRVTSESNENNRV
jgi:hypothetical protein